MRTPLIPTLLATLMAGGVSAACLPAADAEAVDIFPTAQELPENLLRFYVYFPHPMAQQDILDHIVLIDATGQSVKGALLRNRYDLWSPDRRRLTLLLDPGRVKTGLEAHEALGRALVPGQRYSLTILGTALDARGCALDHNAVYSFTVGPADLDPPAPGDWDLSVPNAESADPIVVDLGSPHDHLSLAYRLRVVGADGSVTPGAIALDDKESIWRFTPRDPWNAETYTLTVDPRLEDLAGNRPDGLFDRPVDTAAADWISAIPFRPGAPQP
ncbi:MAG: hypothetical protein AAGA19_16515 [Pseudomonadota bacterium]